MLGNSCASYVQFRAGPAIIERAVEVNSRVLAEDVMFIGEQDEFVLEQDVPSLADRRKIYLLSEKKLEEFQQTLKRFNETLRKKNIIERLKIPTRDPADFDIDYVLTIAKRIGELDHKSDEINTCIRFARQVCQKAAKNKDILWGLVSLAPTDVYGSLISGGFTIILAALEAHENLRTRMEEALAKIPKELKRIRTLSDVYIQREELHKHANDILVSIFTVLERIIEQFSRTWREKVSLKFRDNGGSVDDALKMLSDSITEFNQEADVCAHLRMGRLEETGQTIKVTAEDTRDVVKGTSTKIEELGSLVKGISDRQNAGTEDYRHIIHAVNRLYTFIASNPAFNAADGTVDRKYLASIEVENGRNRSIKLVDGWFRRLGDFQPSSKNDIKVLIEHSQALTLKDQDKVQYIMGCQRFHRWLGKLSSSALCVRAETAPDDIINFISVSTAVLALTLGAATRFISLSFFCSSRRKSSPREQDSGALGILNSLNGQLLKIMLERQLLVKPSFAQDEKMWSKSTKSITHSWRLFTKLMELLPPRSVVFVLLDSISCASGEKSMVDELAEKILRFGRRSHSIVVKLLVTDPVPSSHCRRTADFSLHVPDDVDGWKCGMNVESMKRKNALKLRDLEDLKESEES